MFMCSWRFFENWMFYLEDVKAVMLKTKQHQVLHLHYSSIAVCNTLHHDYIFACEENENYMNHINTMHSIHTHMVSCHLHLTISGNRHILEFFLCCTLLCNSLAHIQCHHLKVDIVIMEYSTFYLRIWPLNN
jgi:hypothetical protein